MEENSYWKNLIDDLKKSFSDKSGIFVWIFSIIISIILGCFLTNKEKDINISRLSIVCIAIAASCVIVIAYYGIKHIAIYMHNTYITSLYGDVIKNLTQWNYELKEICKKEESNTEWIQKLKMICNGLKEFFDKKTHSKCAVSIKVAVSRENDISSWEFKNICRDDKSISRDTDQYKNARHNVLGNTAYDHIINNLLQNKIKKIAYINDDIPNTKDYKNTSKFDDDTNLPYQSEIVYPIMRMHTIGKDTQMCGFICVDCNKKYNFGYVKYDESILESITDNLYDVLTQKLGKTE